MGKEMERAEAFARELEGIYGDALVSVVLYGSGARGEFREGASDLNILVLLRSAGPEALRQGSPAAVRWAAAGNPPPLILAEQEWLRSADVFAIEYADMMDAHRILGGRDAFAGMRIESADLRHQCERELKGKHIQLRERYLLLADRPDELGSIFVRSLSTFLVLFRTVLRLSGEAVPRDASEVVRRTAERVGFDAAPILRLVEVRETRTALPLQPTDPVAIGYLDAVERVVEYVDRLMEAARE